MTTISLLAGAGFGSLLVLALRALRRPPDLRPARLGDCVCDEQPLPCARCDRADPDQVTERLRERIRERSKLSVCERFGHATIDGECQRDGCGWTSYRDFDARR